MKKSYYLAAAMLGLVITTAAISITSLAATNNPDPSNLIPKHQVISQAVIDNDYNAWASAMQEKVKAMRDQADQLESRINQETFSKLVEAQKLVRSGDLESARAIFEELGMKGPLNGKAKGFQRGMHLGQRFGDR